jgi:hypothetical protein
LESLPVLSKFEQGVRDGSEKEIEQRLSVEEHEWNQLVGNREYHVEVMCGQDSSPL